MLASAATGCGCRTAAASRSRIGRNRIDTRCISSCISGRISVIVASPIVHIGPAAITVCAPAPRISGITAAAAISTSIYKTTHTLYSPLIFIL